MWLLFPSDSNSMGCFHVLSYGWTLCGFDFELYRVLLQMKMVLDCFKEKLFLSLTTVYFSK